MIPPPSLHSSILCDCDMVSVLWGFPFSSPTFFLFPPGFISLFRLFCFVCVCFCYLPKQQCILYLYFVETATATKTDRQVFILNSFLFHRVLLAYPSMFSLMISVCLCVWMNPSHRKLKPSWFVLLFAKHGNEPFILFFFFCCFLFVCLFRLVCLPYKCLPPVSYTHLTLPTMAVV